MRMGVVNSAVLLQTYDNTTEERSQASCFFCERLWMIYVVAVVLFYLLGPAKDISDYRTR